MSAGSQLSYDVLISGLLPASAEPLPNGDRPHWSPLSHTLIYGPTEAVVVDPPITVAQTTALADWIASFGRRLAYIYITHWHADHWLGTGELVKRFPGVTVYATVLHAPSIGLVAAGDVVYNNVHQYLAETGAVGLAGWYQALDIVGSLQPAHVVAGHKDATRDDSPDNIGQTRRYLDDAARLLAAGPTREEYFFQMLQQYPQRVNPYTVWLSARRLLADQ